MGSVLRWFFARRGTARATRAMRAGDRRRCIPARVTALPLGAAKPLTGRTPMPFLALDLSLDLIRSLRPTIELLRRKSPRLRRQLEDTLAGIVQNLCEGSGRFGGDAAHLYR